MSRINSRKEIKEYALRALGAPVILINIDDEQIEDRVDDALDLFWEYHADGTELVFFHHQITEEEKENQVVVLPSDVLSVISVYDGTGGNGGSTGIANVNLQYQSYITEMMSSRRITSGGLSSYYITSSYLQGLSDTFSPPGRKEFNKHHNKLYLQGGWDAITVGHWISIEGYRPITEESTNDIWNNRWLKKYITALCKYQWGSNLMKFTGVTLPGQIQVNAQEIFNTAKEEVKELETELHQNYELPPDFFVG